MIIFDDDGIGYDVIPSKTIEKIKSEIKNYLENEKYSDDGISDVGIGLELALNIIDRVVKEHTE